jgi:DUF4097 and DUF4098 domain-containing protein YvlB
MVDVSIRGGRTMNRMKIVRLGIALSTLAACFTMSLAGTPIDERRPADAEARITIGNVINGSVTIKGWDRKEVVLSGTLGDGTEGLEISGSEKRIKIELDYPKGRWDRRIEDTDLIVQVPRLGEIHVSGVNADIEASEMMGTLELETVNGEIVITGAPRSIEAQTVNGSIEIDAESQEVDVESVSGEIVLSGLRGEVSAASVSGDIEITGGEFDEGDFASVSGSIHFEGILARDGTFDFESHSGTIRLLLPASVSADFEISTFSGDIENDFGPEARRTSDYAPGKELIFTTGDGAADVVISSFSGEVILRKR